MWRRITYVGPHGVFTHPNRPPSCPQQVQRILGNPSPLASYTTIHALFLHVPQERTSMLVVSVVPLSFRCARKTTSPMFIPLQEAQQGHQHGRPAGAGYVRRSASSVVTSRKPSPVPSPSSRPAQDRCMCSCTALRRQSGTSNTTLLSGRATHPHLRLPQHILSRRRATRFLAGQPQLAITLVPVRSSSIAAFPVLSKVGAHKTPNPSFQGSFAKSGSAP